MYSGFLITQFGSDSIKELFEIYLTAEALEVSNHIENGWIFKIRHQKEENLRRLR